MLQSLLNKTISAVDAKEYLLQMAEEHPYFAPIHFFLTQQTATGNTVYNDRLAKTAILFNNPYWLNFQLQKFNAPSVVINEPLVLEEEKAPEIENITTSETAEEHIANDTDNSAEAITTEEDPAPIKIDLKLSAAVQTTEETIAFEPLHTTDYFASQGIKLSEEVKPTDKLGKQLKSFTEWLKTMKKVHTESAAEDSPGNDAAIQTLAEKSNTEDVVLTEAMADVLIQQGKTGKAVEVYQKLSLLNPTKSAYFAAKIEQIKG